MEDFNILFTSSGRRVSLIKHFKQTLKKLGLKGKIITADAKYNAPTAFISDYHLIAPAVTDQAYVTFLRQIVERYNIKLIIPLIDTELAVLASLKEEFSRQGVIVLVSDKGSIEIANDKRKTYEFFTANGIKTPFIYHPDSIIEGKRKDFVFPLLIKPANGSGSAGVAIINNCEELKFFANYIKNPLLQEYIYGAEYTIDVLLDLNGKVVSIVPRLRIETRAGEVSKGRTVKNQVLITKAKEVVEKLPGAVGCITLQCFKTIDNEIVFIEINPRFGGGVPLSIEAGADFPRWIIQLLIGEEIEVGIDEWDDGVVMLRYDSEIFITGKNR